MGVGVVVVSSVFFFFLFVYGRGNGRRREGGLSDVRTRARRYQGVVPLCMSGGRCQ